MDLQKWDFLSDLQREVNELNNDKGWYEEDRSFGDLIALLHSEVSEAFEAFREIGFEERTRLPVEHQPGCETFLLSECNCVGKPDDVASELADVFIRLLDMCDRYDIDLLDEYERKMAYNRTRPYKHGGKAL